MLRILLVCYVISFIVGLSAVVRVWRSSMLDGLLTLLVPFYVFIAMAKYWNEPDSDIRYHVALLVVCAGAALWARNAVLRDLAAEVERREAELHARAGRGADPAIDAGADDDDEAAPAAAGAARRPDPTPLAAAPSVVRPADFPNIAASVMFLRGRYERETAGFGFAIPDRFRVLSGHDAHRLETALGRPDDPHLAGWALHERVTLTDPGAWHIVIRWHDDGAVPREAVDPPTLLAAAQRAGAARSRLAGSGGDLVGYAIAPDAENDVVAWVEERLPAGSGQSVLDCHALRLGGKGVIEYSVVAAAPGTQGSCYESVRLFAMRTELTATGRAERAAGRAPYSLAGLLAHSQ